MANQIGISLYKVRLHERRDKNYLQLDKLEGNIDFLKFVHDSLKSRHNQFIGLPGGKRRLQVTGDLAHSGRILHGTLEVGESGHASTLRDVRSGDATYRRKPTDAEMIPLYFRAWSPKGARFAAFAFQHYGDYGCKTAVQEVIETDMKKKLPNFVLSMREAVPGEVVNKFIKKGLVKQLRFTRFGVPSDRADSYGRFVAAPEEANIELNIVAKRRTGLTLTSVISAVTGRQEIDPRQFLELDGIEYNRFKMKINLQGKDRWLSVGQIMTMHSRIDVSTDVIMGPNGHPTRASIEEVCQALLEKIANEPDR